MKQYTPAILSEKLKARLHEEVAKKNIPAQVAKRIKTEFGFKKATDANIAGRVKEILERFFESKTK